MIRAAVLGGVALPCLLFADSITLSGGEARLSGTIVSIDDAGLVELSTDMSPGPVLLKNGAVDKVEFSPHGEAVDLPAGLLELVNGDKLPVSIESLDERRLRVVSPDAGPLEIPRAVARSLQLGVQNRRVTYSGPKSLAEWTEGDGQAKNWSFERKSLVATGSASASREVELPERFIIRFKLAWEDHNNPNFQISFADPLLPKGEPSDRYYLQFASAGLELKREVSTGKRWNSLLLLNRTPKQYADRELNVEIRMDRKISRGQIFLNGEPEGEFIDHSETVPKGAGIGIVSEVTAGKSQSVSAIEILVLDDLRARHRAEERGDPKQDSLISREDDRWGGRLLSIDGAEGQRVFRFKSDFQADPMEIPEKDVSTVFLAESDPGATADGVAESFVLRFRGNGNLTVGSCRFDEKSITTRHPLLGLLELQRDGVLAMERIAAPEPETEPEP